MKYFIALLLAFSAFLGSNRLLAAEIEHLTYSWSGNEEELYLNISLLDEVELPGNYTTFKTKNGQGQGCEIICKPAQEGTVFSSKGQKLNEIKLTVVLNNVDNPNKVAYTTITKSSYVGINEKGLLVSTTSESKREGVLNNPAIDLTQDPVFFTINDGLHEGVISFKNSFPYSNIQ